MSQHLFQSHCPTITADSPNHEFATRIDKAMKVVKTMLDNTRNPSLASTNHEHTYGDKFTLSEFLTNTALSSLFNVLVTMGLGSSNSTSQATASQEDTNTNANTTDTAKAADALRKMISLVENEKKNITMRFIARETCVFVRKEEIEIESPHSIVQEKTTTTTNSGAIGSPSSSTNTVSELISTSVKTKIEQFYWKVEIEYGIFTYCGQETQFNAVNSQPILTKAISCEIITKTSQPPFSPVVDTNPLDVSLTWLLKNANKESLQSQFRINRENDSCRTPRNNDDIFEAWKFFDDIGLWFVQVGDYFVTKDNTFNSYDDKVGGNHLSSISGDGIFVPVLPIFESIENKDDDSTSPILPAEDVRLLLEKQYLTMNEEIKNIASHFVSSESLMTAAESSIVLLTKHVSSIAGLWLKGVDHIEDMLCTQLYNAIGKLVSSNDLDEFVRSNNQKLFLDSYAPEPFCYAIRRPGHFPDGMISIEQELIGISDKKGSTSNAMTFTRQLETSNGDYPMFIPINSATSVEFKGNLFLHAWMLQRFQEKPCFKLASRARQFSSFLLLVGKLTGPNTFEPEDGIILQNKDEVLIPLIMDEMPSAKEFKDAIASLSPEQQRFAKAFRNMKLSSSVFGVCVVQLKPQLEILLGLPEKSLTKEIRLTQDLLSLFIDYQIPSDLLSDDGADDLDSSENVTIVKQHVKNVQDMIDTLKERDLKEARMEADMAFEQYSSSVYEEEEEAADCEEGFFDLFSSPPPPPMQQSAQSYSRSVKVGGKSLQAPPPKPKTTSSAKKKAKRTQPAPESSTSTNLTNNNKTAFEDGVEYSDLTKLPQILDSQFEMFSNDERYGGALRSTIVKSDEVWTKKYKKNLLSELETVYLNSDKKKAERNKAFDLLDALSRSGVLPMSHSELHVIIASTHCFDKSVVNTVVQDNVNPIEKIERSHLLVASMIHNVGIHELISKNAELERIAKHNPMLIKDDAEDSKE
jgi:hypothetical protein